MSESDAERIMQLYEATGGQAPAESGLQVRAPRLVQRNLQPWHMYGGGNP